MRPHLRIPNSIRLAEQNAAAQQAATGITQEKTPGSIGMVSMGATRAYGEAQEPLLERSKAHQRGQRIQLVDDKTAGLALFVGSALVGIAIGLLTPWKSTHMPVRRDPRYAWASWRGVCARAGTTLPAKPAVRFTTHGGHPATRHDGKPFQIANVYADCVHAGDTAGVLTRRRHLVTPGSHS
jgi:hypothetical protein